MPWRSALSKQHAQRQQDNLWRELRIVESAPGRIIASGGKQLLNFCSNNYLSLSQHPQVIAAATSATQKYGVGTTASHLIVGHNEIHHRLETRIAQFVGAEKAILFSSGYMANLALPTTFLRRTDVIVQDRLNHASIIDAAKISDAKLRRYHHADVRAANKILAKSASDPQVERVMLVTDGVFSMDGDIAPLGPLHNCCTDNNALMIVDDAHGFGTVGQGGRGCLSSFSLRPQGNVIMLGTLSKAVGAFGAFIAGDAIYIDSLAQQARSFIYTTALPCSAAAAALTAIELIETESWRRNKLQDNIGLFRTLAVAAGVPLTRSSTAIQPIIVGDGGAALEISRQLEQAGIIAVAIRPPTVPIEQSRIRITLMSDHTQDDIQKLISALETIRQTIPND